MKLKLVLLLSALSISQPGLCGEGTGKITGFVPYFSGADETIIIMTQSITGTPACNNTARFAIKSSDPKFKGTRAAPMAAYLAGSPVIVRGSNTCNTHGNSEDLLYMCVGSIPC